MRKNDLLCGDCGGGRSCPTAERRMDFEEGGGGCVGVDMELRRVGEMIGETMWFVF